MPTTIPQGMAANASAFASASANLHHHSLPNMIAAVRKDRASVLEKVADCVQRCTPTPTHLAQGEGGQNIPWDEKVGPSGALLHETILISIHLHPENLWFGLWIMASYQQDHLGMSPVLGHIDAILTCPSLLSLR